MGVQTAQDGVPFTLQDVVTGAIGPFAPYCMGYMNPTSSGWGYIATMKLSCDLVSMEGLDTGTQGIVSYDRCEADDAYIGQINMLTASSFCGVNGALWGFHLGVADEIANGTLQPMYYQQQGTSQIPVYPVAPLLDCAQRLFGVDSQRRFPPLPGSHVVCANKNTTQQGPTWVWASIAIAIADDRQSQANLFIEDTGSFDGSWTEQQVISALNGTQVNVTNSVIMCGVDQEVQYSAIYVGYKYLYVPADFVGCSLACAPYVLLAQNAVPSTGAASMVGMTITQWENAISLPPLPPVVQRTPEQARAKLHAQSKQLKK